MAVSAWHLHMSAELRNATVTVSAFETYMLQQEQVSVGLSTTIAHQEYVVLRSPHHELQLQKFVLLTDTGLFRVCCRSHDVRDFLPCGFRDQSSIESLVAHRHVLYACSRPSCLCKPLVVE